MAIPLRLRFWRGEAMVGFPAASQERPTVRVLNRLDLTRRLVALLAGGAAVIGGIGNTKFALVVGGPGLALIAARVDDRPGLGRPEWDPVVLKDRFMRGIGTK